MSETTAAATAPAETQTPMAPSAPETGREESPTHAAPTQDGAAATPAPVARSATEVRREAMEKLRAKLTGKAEAPALGSAPEADASEPKVDATGRLHGPDGKYVPKSGDAEPAGADAAPADEAPQPEAADAVPEGMVRVKIHDGHPLRHRLKGDTVDVPESVAELVQWANNNGVRSTEVQTYRQQIAQLTEQSLRLQAQLEARANGAPSKESDPYYQTLKANGLEDVAERYWRGVEAEIAATEGERFQALQGEHLQTEAKTYAEQFVQRAYAHARSALPPELAALPQVGQHLQQARAVYGSILEQREAAGQYGTESEQEFLTYFRNVLLSDGQVQGILRQRMTQEQEAERARLQKEAEQRALEAAKEAEKQKLLAAGQRHSTKHPLGAIPSHVRTDRQTTGAGVDLSEIPAHQRKKAIKQALFGGR